MTTRHLIDPELLDALASFPEFDLEGCDLVALREACAAGLPPPETYSRDDVTVEYCRVPGMNGASDVPLILYRPTNANGLLPVFLNIHGGGYMFGTAADTGPTDVRTSAELGCLVASVEYRLAPETSAPGALEDCYAALSWLFGQADALGLDRTRFAVGGMSAGGGLAAALALYARDRGEIPLCFQLLIYPMLDDRTVTRPATEDNRCTGEFVWDRRSNAIGWRSLLGHEPGQSGVSPYAAPARATEFAGLPPAYITVGMLDLFLEENVDYARRLMAAGVSTEIHVLPGAFHGFEFAADAQVSRRSDAERRRALRDAFAKTGAASRKCCDDQSRPSIKGSAPTA